jgi:hypothetical protein
LAAKIQNIRYSLDVYQSTRRIEKVSGIIYSISLRKILHYLRYLKHLLRNLLFLLDTKNHSCNPIICLQQQYKKNSENNHHDYELQQRKSLLFHILTYKLNRIITTTEIHLRLFLIISDKTFKNHFSCFVSFGIKYMRFNL